jgi:hypothetical protein
MSDQFNTPQRRLSSSDQVSDLVSTLKAYARQETVEPIKGAARWVAVGTIASLCLGLAMIFLLMAILRLSQDLGGTVLDGSWSFVHYFITLAVAAVLVVLTFSRISQRSLSKGG